jgi:CubicO group peptidase (beta-lactamase class C family)
MWKRSFDISNWGYPPHNRASFQQVQSLFPTVRLRRGPGPIVPFGEALRELGDVEVVGTDRHPRSVRQVLDTTYTDAWLVVKDGAIVAEAYRNGMTADSHHLLNSVSKSFLGMLAGVLAADGVLDPGAQLSTYLPEFQETAFARTTVQHALDMTAAVRYGEDYADPAADFWRETAVVGWRTPRDSASIPPSLLAYACSLNDTDHADGTHFHYRTVLTNVVGMAIERATGQSLAALMEVRIWQKLRPEQDAAVVVDRTGFPYFGAGMNACARDLARFGQMLLENGRYAGEQIVPANWVQDTVRGSDALRALFAASDYAGMIEGGHYRNQVWAAAEPGTMFCIGIHGQTIYVNQPARVVIVKLSTHPQPVEAPLFADAFTAMGAVAAGL